MTVDTWLNRHQTALKKNHSVLIVHTHSTCYIGVYQSHTKTRLIIDAVSLSRTRILLMTITDIECVTRTGLSRFLRRIRNTAAMIFEGPPPPLVCVADLPSEEICFVLEEWDSLCKTGIHAIGPSAQFTRT